MSDSVFRPPGLENKLVPEAFVEKPWELARWSRAKEGKGTSLVFGLEALIE
jgi:hypothetical protein